METTASTLQIQGPVVVLPVEEYLEQQNQLDELRRLRAIYKPEREYRFRRMMAIASRNRDIPFEQVQDDVAAAVEAVRS
ncbi:MAG: hypothetical protein KKD28_01355 [Chloroflexi bacterium]|nr:hypothetical protein [Chloroflexota bacterium]MBU1660100.1 hypothetical protein [Chloroflexota bacterium]